MEVDGLKRWGMKVPDDDVEPINRESQGLNPFMEIYYNVQNFMKHFDGLWIVHLSPGFG